MKMCLKCRTFYDDNIKFCLSDGVPLLNIGRTHDLWEKGTEALWETQKTVTRQIRRQNIKKTISTAVTTVLIVMVVSIVALNSYVYLNLEIRENAQDTQPRPLSLPIAPMALLPPSNSPLAEESPLPTPAPAEEPEEPSPSLTPPGKPVPEAASEVKLLTQQTLKPLNTPVDTPAATPKLHMEKTLPKLAPADMPVDGSRPNRLPALESTATINLRNVSLPPRTLSPVPAPATDVWAPSPPPPPTPASMKTPASSGCSVKDKLSIEETIKNRFTSGWEKEIAESGESVLLRKQFSWETFVAFRNTSAALRLPVDIIVKPSKNCKKADVKIKYTWHIESRKKQKEYGGVQSYQCSNNGDDWDCQKKSQRLFCIFGV